MNVEGFVHLLFSCPVSDRYCKKDEVLLFPEINANTKDGRQIFGFVGKMPGIRVFNPIILLIERVAARVGGGAAHRRRQGCRLRRGRIGLRYEEVRVAEGKRKYM